VPLAGEGEGALDLLAVDRGIGLGAVLLHDREEVAEQLPLFLAQPPGDLVERSRLGGQGDGSDLGVTAAILGGPVRTAGPARLRRRGLGRTRTRAVAARALPPLRRLLLGGGLAAYGCICLPRNAFASSSWAR
jgi:hypothetical protein